MLSAESTQGVKEFLNEIIAISGVEHENLVKLYGCCVEENQRILVYGYVENNSLSQTLLGNLLSLFLSSIGTASAFLTRVSFVYRFWAQQYSV